MYCRFCGAEIQETDRFCKKCGKSVQNIPATVESSASSQKAQTEPVNHKKSGFCPNCGAGPENCQPIPKVNVKTSGSGYSFWDGCCGMILLGPAGLLCGACGGGVKTEVRSETWLVCQKCGTEFMSKQSILEKAYTAMRSSALYTAFLSFGIGIEWGGPNALWTAILCGIIIMGLWGSIIGGVEKSARCDINDFLTDDEQITFYGKYCLYLVAGFALGLFVGLRS